MIRKAMGVNFGDYCGLSMWPNWPTASDACLRSILTCLGEFHVQSTSAV